MSDFAIKDMLAMQQTLQEKYKDKWETICPEAGKHKLLWMLPCGSSLLRKWQMCSCITTMSFCVMEFVSRN